MIFISGRVAAVVRAAARLRDFFGINGLTLSPSLQGSVRYKAACLVANLYAYAPDHYRAVEGDIDAGPMCEIHLTDEPNDLDAAQRLAVSMANLLGEPVPVTTGENQTLLFYASPRT